MSRPAAVLLAGYSVALFVGLLIGTPWLLLRLLSRRRWREGLLQRLTVVLPPRRGDRARVWFHAASAGEMAAAAIVVRELERRRPDLEVVLSSTTATGVEVAKRELPGRAAFVQPLDLGPLVRRVLGRVDPVALVLVELELWPNLVHAARAAGVALMVANGRISPRSARRYSAPWVRALVGVGSVDRYSVQTDEYRSRLRALDVSDDRITVTGNVKADAAPRAAPAGLRESLGFAATERIVVAGSTHPGEVAVIARAIAVANGAVITDRPGRSVRLLVAPRHRERLIDAERELSAAGFAPVRLTALRAGAACPANAAVVVDTMGELVLFYAIADVAIVGGSFVAGVGGHNVFEPVLAGAPTLIGPWHANVRADAAYLAETGALAILDRPDRLAECLVEWLAIGRGRADAAKNALERARGANRRTVDLLLELLSKRGPVASNAPTGATDAGRSVPGSQALERKHDG